ncbi:MULTISPECIES: dihydroneopterin aldolase [Gilliamella]|uniref:7,8-dihydroneopterin aldolase n=1 Tax=Gilliamella apicola TaxID=1196095 RepID=A0A556SZ04_9GAMM|nr:MULTISPECIES: dihydroneopterin aldolase [Gilliamella]MBI0031843.1 dihydroneopterin aldolase [Gilliamella sp. B14384G15]MBI0059218.1 dihydroneopterin aldolase [Gilliamella sp. B14384G12]MBI0095721.1 dihydroneopterin aldolase [Gilliamella sp. W8136]MCT6867732.1 dihydroneopterin aldolase [Gilliamella apicola]TSK06306.1 dihydroneopterin aldolase [Gilliamella apicola]
MKINNKDRVLIEGLTVLTTIGVYEWEKTIKQKLILDLEMSWDNQPAGESDDVTLCLDYFLVSQSITNFIQSTQFELIECVAERVAQLVIQTFSVQWLKVKVSKPGAIANASNVAVVIERSAN